MFKDNHKPILESQIRQKMENEMEAGELWDTIYMYRGRINGSR